MPMTVDTTDALSNALRDFESSLSTQQRADLHAVNTTPDTNAVVAFTAQIDKENASRRIRGVAGRLHKSLESIQQFTSIVDTFVSANPQTAALIWGSFKVVILIAQRFASIDKVSEWFMKWGSYCPIFAAYRDLYPRSLRLQKALCLFYATLIQLCKKAVQVLQRTGTTHFFKALNPFDNEFDLLDRELQRRSIDVQEEIRLASAQAADHERQLQVLERSRNNIFRRGVSEEQKIRQIQKSEQKRKVRRRRLLDELSSHDHVKPLRRERIIRYGQTGVWLSQSKEYSNWLTESTSSLFWLSGIPGAGKTVLTTAVIDDLLLRHSAGQTSVRFFFCEYDNQTTLLARAVLGCLARQCLSEENLSNSIEAKIQALIAGTLPEAEALKNILQEIADTSGTYFIVIDGLDECSLEERQNILKILKKIALSSSSVLKIFLSSRQDVGMELERIFGSYYHRTMDCKENCADIGMYVENAIEERTSTGQLAVGDPNLLVAIRNALVDGAHGMFLWVSFQIADICDQICDEDICRVIKKLPRNLTETYERALHRINRNNKAAIAQKVFRWVIAAKRPLALDELGEAIVIEPCQKSLRSGQRINNINLLLPWCGNLLVQDEEEKLVHLAHHTVKEFLLSQHSTPSLQCFESELMDVDHEAGEICCTYLNLDNLKGQMVKPIRIEPSAVINASLPFRQSLTFLTSIAKLKGDSKLQHGNFDFGRQLYIQPNTSEKALDSLQAQFPFFTYANKYWLSHTATFSKASSKTWSLFDHLLRTEAALGIKDWDSSEVLDYVIDHSHWGLLGWEFDWVGNGNDPTIRDNLSIIRYGFKNERLLLLAAGSPLDRATAIVSQAGFWYGLDRAIETAAKDGNLRQVERLISFHDPEKSKKQRPNINLALVSAARLGHVEVVKRLLDVRSIDRSPDPFDIEHAIDAAEEGGHKATLVFLLNAKKEIELKRTLLAEAAATGDCSEAETLLETGVDINAVTDSSTALQIAVQNNQLGVVDVLLAWQADVGVGAGTSNGTVLQEAVRYGLLEMVEHLCQACAILVDLEDDENSISIMRSKCYGAWLLDSETSVCLKASDILQRSYNAQNMVEEDYLGIWVCLIKHGYAEYEEVPKDDRMVVQDMATMNSLERQQRREATTRRSKQLARNVKKERRHPKIM